jgi:hypothetical protein
MKEERKNTNVNLLEHYKMETLLSLLRGPLLLSAVLLPLFARHLLLMRLETIFSMVLLTLGLALTCHDFFQLLESKTRDFIHRSINAVVLDDVMKSLLDPASGMLPCLLGVILGNATMYSLPLSTSQRVRLLQSCLAVPDEEVATHILMEPGGIQQLLPRSVRQWLKSSNLCGDDQSAQSPDRLESTTGTCEDHDEDFSSSSTNSCQDTDTEMERSDATQARVGDTGRTYAKQEREQTPISADGIRSPVSVDPPPDPLVVMGTILKELSFDGVSRLTQGIPDAWLQRASVAGAVAFYLQLRSSPRTRRMVLGVLEGSTAIGFASVALGALIALVAKNSIIRANPSPTAGVRLSTTLMPASLVYLLLKRIKDRVSTHVSSTQVKAAIALLLVYYLRRSRPSRTIPRRI